MNEDRREKRLAYEAARAHHRGYYERHFPAKVLGARPAEPVTPEVLAEIERLKAAEEAAHKAWQEAVQNR
ncbi:MAG: hypothetical protein M0R73_09160 [Dehalococcoidia bacterium]|nr:hypothetical protein [Dehalococcoidia bacterium]